MQEPPSSVRRPCSSSPNFCGKTFLLDSKQKTNDKNKTAQEQKTCLIHTYSSLGFIRACEDLCWNRDKSSPFRSETKGIGENAVRRVKEGTSGLLIQYFCYLRNTQPKLADRKSPCEITFGTPLDDGPVIAFLEWQKF